jgi:hypothetical protein
MEERSARTVVRALCLVTDVGGMLLLSRPSGTLSSISEMEERDGERRSLC